MTEDEMLRLACIYAEGDREDYLAAWENCSDAEARRIKKATAAFIKKIHAYRIKRWGPTRGDTLMKANKS